MAYKMKGFGGFKPSPVKEDKKIGRDNSYDQSTESKNNIKQIQESIKNYSDKDKKGIVDRNLPLFNLRGSVGFLKDPLSPDYKNKGADSVQAVLNTYLEEKNAPTKMKKKSPAKMQKKIKKVSFKPSLSKPKSDGLVPMGKGGTMNHIKSLQKMEKQAKTGMEKAKIRESIATAREEYNKPIYNQEKSSPAKKRGLWDNIHAKRKRGEKMRKKGAKGAPTEKAIRDSQ